MSLLNSSGIEYLLIGGYAVSLYGFVRHTKDLDVWIDPTDQTVSTLIEVLVKFGFSRDTLERGPLFGDNRTVLRMGLPPDRIEVLSSISGVQFPECYQRRQTMLIDGLDVPVIHIDDLIANKRASGRDSDLRDIDKLARNRASRRMQNP